MRENLELQPEEFFKLFTCNYQNLHDAFWECHKIYWGMTSIFLPIILAISTLILKDITNDLILIFSFVIFLILLTFWLLITKYLYSWNQTRKAQLIHLEKYFNEYLNKRFPSLKKAHDEECISFMQYGLPYEKNYRRHFKNVFKPFRSLDFQTLNLLLYILLVVGNIGILLIKLFDC